MGSTAPAPAFRTSAFWLAAGAFFVTMFGTTLPTPLYPIYRQQFGFSPVLITVIFAVYAIGVILGLLWFGHLSDEIGRRRVLFAALALSALSALTFLLARGLPELFAGRILSGFSAGMFTGTGTAMLTELAGESRRTFATAAAVAVNVGGLSLGPLAAGLLAQYVAAPLRIPYAVDLVMLVPATFGFLAVPETVEKTEKQMRLRFARLRIPNEIRGIFIRASIVGVCGFAVAGVYSSVAPSILGEVMHLHAPALAGAVVFLFLATAASGQIGVRRVPEHLAFPLGCAILVVGLGLLAASIAAASLAMLFIAAVISGVGWGLTVGFGLMQINQKVQERRGEVTSTYFTILYVGLIVPVLAVGLIATVIGLADSGILFCGIVGLTVLAVLVSLVRQ